MTLKLYNTLTKSKELFEPLDPQNVRMYVCGPTVYDFAHIGNARPIIVFDVLYRLLRHIYGEDHVKYVRNITDVDDKINARAAEEYPDLPLNEAIAEVTTKTTKQFHEDIAALGVLKPDVEPKCTAHIAEMIEMIKVLIAKGNAYEAENHVLLDVTSIKDYGRLSRRSLDEMIAGARVEVAPYKKNPADSVLWKPSTDEQPGWDSPWGRGRPGWHIECSAMAEKHLGQTFDIHGGGIDLQFPHHENELAQSCAAHGTDTMAKVWLHNGFLQVVGKKMSKSDGNSLTINAILQTPVPALTGADNDITAVELRSIWNGLAVRFSMLQTKYREPLDWTEQRFIEASNELYKWYEYLRKVTFDCSLKALETPKVLEPLCDDLNTWGAITQMRQAFKELNPRELGEGMVLLGLLHPKLIEHDDILLFDRTSGVAKMDVETLIAARVTARANKNWAEADRIRDELVAMGIQLMDTKNPDTGEIETTWEVKR